MVKGVWIEDTIANAYNYWLNKTEEGARTLFLESPINDLVIKEGMPGYAEGLRWVCGDILNPYQIAPNDMTYSEASCLLSCYEMFQYNNICHFNRVHIEDTGNAFHDKYYSLMNHWFLCNVKDYLFTVDGFSIIDYERYLNLQRHSAFLILQNPYFSLSYKGDYSKFHDEDMLMFSQLTRTEIYQYHSNLLDRQPIATLSLVLSSGCFQDDWETLLKFVSANSCLYDSPISFSVYITFKLSERDYLFMHDKCSPLDDEILPVYYANQKELIPLQHNVSRFHMSIQSM